MGFGYAGKLIEESDQVVWKCEGLSDVLSLLSLGLPDHHTAVTNGCGATERPAKSNEWFSRKLSGKEVFVIHDCDRPGQDGAIGDDKKPGWAPAIAKHASIVRNVVLPYPIAESRGKDLRDWIGDRRSEGKDNSTIYSELIEYARQAKQILPLDAELPTETESDAESDGGETYEGTSTPTKQESKKPVEHPDDPHRLARINLARYQDEHGGTLKYWKQQWWKYKDGRYQSISQQDLRAKVNYSIKIEFDSLWHEENERYEDWVASEAYNEKSDKGAPKVRPVRDSLVQNVIRAMESICILPDSAPMPCWLPDRSRPNYVAMADGILDLDELFKSKEQRDDSKVVVPHSSNWFSSVKLPYSFDPSAKCQRWLNFLDDVFNSDPEPIEALQRWFGYQLFPDTWLHKMMFVIGRPRSGKGTIMRTLIEMMGESSVASPSLSELAGPFGLQTLLGKTIAVIADARLSKRADEVEVTERLLKLTGDDPVDVHRKHIDAIAAVRMPIRFTLFSNQIPRLNDSSNAILTRCIFISMPNSYVGREDPKLGGEIMKELPGILNWAIAGRYKLQLERKIVEPASGRDTRERMEQCVAPVAFFLSNSCTQTGEISVRDLFDAWNDWTRENDVFSQMNIQTFSKKIHDAMPNVAVKQVRIGTDRVRKFQGISLKQEFESETF